MTSKILKSDWYHDKKYRFDSLIINIKRRIKFPFQRLFRGYADEDLWNLDSYLAKLIAVRLRAFKKSCTNGYPACLNSVEEWVVILDKMIYTFDIIADEEKYFGDAYDTFEAYNIKQEEYNKIIKEGLDLFAKYFTNLWD